VLPFPRLLALPVALAMLAAAPVAGANDFPSRTAKLSYVVSADNPVGLGVKKFAEIIARDTGGKTRVRGFPDGQLGAEVQSVAGAQGGMIEMAVVTTAAASTAVKEFGVFDFPFLLDTEKEADALLDGSVGKSLLEKLDARNLVGLCYWEYGFRHVLNSSRPITSANDLQGLKIRVVQSPLFIDTFNALGANATPLAFTELYTALESKALDGAESTYSTIQTSKFHEVQKYLSATKHIYSPAVVLVSKRFWDRLSAAEKKVYQEACHEAAAYQRRTNRESDPQMLAQMQKEGVVFNEIPASERQQMREKVRPVVEKHAEAIGTGLYAEVSSQLERIRAGR